MKISKNTQFSSLSTINNITEEILSLKKSIVNMRISSKFKLIKKNHLYRQAKRNIAYLNFKKSILKTTNI